MVCFLRRAERYETSIERLLWLPAYSPQQRQSASAAAAALTASAATLAVGGSNPSMSSFFAPTADPSLAGVGSQQGFGRPGRLPGLDLSPSAAAAADGVYTSENGLADNDEFDEPPDAVLLLSAGADGVVRVWNINHLGQGKLLCTIPGGGTRWR